MSTDVHRDGSVVASVVTQMVTHHPAINEKYPAFACSRLLRSTFRSHNATGPECYPGIWALLVARPGTAA